MTESLLLPAFQQRCSVTASDVKLSAQRTVKLKQNSFKAVLKQF